ncbi:hypothetical protein [Cohnella nanjingensis]|uniref:hypothetical protein n=1 Tax=Cohnella nanjingensis TaxID=1387779 RepID=UPI001C876A02|nr:hypothetical protein [Cohnella nanjingensis]
MTKDVMLDGVSIGTAERGLVSIREILGENGRKRRRFNDVRPGVQMLEPGERRRHYPLFQHKYSANFLFTLWKRIRKYGVF